MKDCPVCTGRGEVEAGLTFTDAHGEVRVKKNPAAAVTVQTGNKATDFVGAFIVLPNGLVPLWGTAICGRCKGSGLILEG